MKYDKKWGGGAKLAASKQVTENRQIGIRMCQIFVNYSNKTYGNELSRMCRRQNRSQLQQRLKKILPTVRSYFYDGVDDMTVMITMMMTMTWMMAVQRHLCMLV